MPVAIRRILSCLTLIAACTLSGTAQAEEPSLPGGASTLREVHGDWTVTCVIQTQSDGGKVKLCAFSQQQIAQETRQRALAIELQPESDGVRGTLVLPFGLALGVGVTYQLDDSDIGAPQSFRTCLPAGCLIDIAFEARTLAGLKAGSVLKVNATADARGSNGQKMVFSISLTGFSSAYDRVVALTE